MCDVDRKDLKLHKQYWGKYPSALPVVADLDGDGLRDDNCIWWECDAGACAGTDIVFADMGGAFGECQPDGTSDGNDRFHALNCFANSGTEPGTVYPCEDAPPTAYNVDAGGAFGECAPDGVCDGNDAFHALNAFAGTNPCSCPLDGSPAPDHSEWPQVSLLPAADDEVTIELKASGKSSRSGSLVEVEVYLTGGAESLRGYQLHLSSTSGLELVDMFVENRRDHAFAGLLWWDAYNLTTRQMLVGIDAAGITSQRDLYLGTLVYKVLDRSGLQFVELLHDETNKSHRAFIFTSQSERKTLIGLALPAVIKVARERSMR